MSTATSILIFSALFILGSIMLILGIIFLVVFPPLGSSILLAYIFFLSFCSYYYGQGLISNDKKKNN